MTQVEKSLISPAVLAARYSARKTFLPGTIAIDNCPICGSREREEDTLGGDTGWAMCQKCFSAYKMSWPEQSAIEEFYEEEYRVLSEDTFGEYPSKANKGTDIVRVGRQFEIIYKPLKQAKRFLDYGCSSGWSVHCGQYLGVESYGVELNKRDQEHAKRVWDITLYPRLEDLPVRDFDVILMSHVIEHFIDPIGEMRKLCSDYMADKAYILFEVPSIKAASAWAAYHAVLFSPHGLAYAIEQAGMKVVFLNAPQPPLKDSRYPPTLMWAVGYKGDPDDNPLVGGFAS